MILNPGNNCNLAAVAIATVFSLCNMLHKPEVMNHKTYSGLNSTINFLEPLPFVSINHFVTPLTHHLALGAYSIKQLYLL